jgi:3-deoxy-manno-octulosonate cytidylyltransferase (CMP-KDO synthetase)
MNKVLVVIPARMKSTRLPEKPLHLIGTRPMIEYVYRGCKESKLNPVIIIATDDERIVQKCKTFISGKDQVLMTPETLQTGTDRVAWVAKDLDFDYVLNVQGDEPLMNGELLDKLIETTFLCDEKTPVATLATRCSDKDEFMNTNSVKVVLDNFGKALYFSRAGIPASRMLRDKIDFLKHLGLYGFRRNFLLNTNKLEKTNLETQESLEQLRFMANGYGIKVAVVDAELASVDTLEDVKKAEDLLKKRGNLV